MLTAQDAEVVGVICGIIAGIVLMLVCLLSQGSAIMDMLARLNAAVAKLQGANQSIRTALTGIQGDLKTLRDQINNGAPSADVIAALDKLDGVVGDLNLAAGLAADVDAETPAPEAPTPVDPAPAPEPAVEGPSETAASA